METCTGTRLTGIEEATNSKRQNWQHRLSALCGVRERREFRMIPKLETQVVKKMQDG